MVASKELHDHVADLLSYPGPGSNIDVSATIAAVKAIMPGASEGLAKLEELAKDGPSTELEEMFCRTFDNNADFALEIGWQIWGENYDRGAFLVRMRDLMRKCGVTESKELPDHLSHGLRVLGRLPREEARNLATATILPAAKKMLDAFKDEPHTYRGILETVVQVIQTHVASLEPIDV